jgi:hypothetical protein
MMLMPTAQVPAPPHAVLRSRASRDPGAPGTEQGPAPPAPHPQLSAILMCPSPSASSGVGEPGENPMPAKSSGSTKHSGPRDSSGFHHGPACAPKAGPLKRTFGRHCRAACPWPAQDPLPSFLLAALSPWCQSTSPAIIEGE